MQSRSQCERDDKRQFPRGCPHDQEWLAVGRNLTPISVPPQFPASCSLCVLPAYIIKLRHLPRSQRCLDSTCFDLTSFSFIPLSHLNIYTLPSYTYFISRHLQIIINPHVFSEIIVSRWERKALEMRILVIRLPKPWDTVWGTHVGWFILVQRIIYSARDGWLSRKKWGFFSSLLASKAEFQDSKRLENPQSRMERLLRDRGRLDMYL